MEGDNFMNDDSYYRCLGVIDRINEEAISKFGSGYKFSKALGRNTSWWNVRYSAATFPRLENINTYAKLFNVSVDYLLTGKNRKPYYSMVVCCGRLYNEYKSHKIPVDKCKKYAPIMFRVKQGHEVNLSTLFDFENMFNIPAYELGFKRSQNFSAK